MNFKQTNETHTNTLTQKIALYSNQYNNPNGLNNANNQQNANTSYMANMNNNNINNNNNSNLLSSPKGHEKKKSLTNSFFDNFDGDDSKINDSSANYSLNSASSSSNSSQQKARQEIEVRWTCPLCTYNNNMFMAQCEICQTIKPTDAVLIQVKQSFT